MSLLGKILLFVNLLAAAGLAYLTAQDWAKRQEVAGLALRYVLTLDGIPVEEAKDVEVGDDEVALAVSTAPGHTTTVVTKKLLDAHFAGPAPRAQVQEVEEVKRKLDGLVTGAANDAEKLRLLCGGFNAQNQFEPGVLMRFADTFEERQAIRALAATRQPQQMTANVTDARRRLDRKFDALLSPPNPAAAQADAQKLAELQGKLAANPNDQTAVEELRAFLAQGAPPYARDDADRKNRIAQVLMLHDVGFANQSRVVKVVGLRVYARSLNEQTGHLEEVFRRVERQMEQDQLKFQEEYDLLKRLAVEQDQLLFQQRRVVEGLQNQAAADDTAVNLRQTQLNDLERNLRDVTDAVARLLQAQADVEKSLFDVQRRVGETLRGNHQLEEKLLRTEEGK